jgi:hypothetical protein
MTILLLDDEQVVRDLRWQHLVEGLINAAP